MTITSYFGLKPCCDCGRTGNYTVNKNGYQFTVCADCIQNYSDEEEQTCSNCKHYAKTYELCCYSLGDEDYDCRGRKWEKVEND